jgi:Beta-glucan synthesis-associated protein SKN1/KRE6/Sbg1
VERKVNDYKAFDEIKKFYYPDKKYIQSGMIQSWNKFCFIGGIVEFSAKLPGDPHTGGLWPARKLPELHIIIINIGPPDNFLKISKSSCSMDAG